MKSAILQSRRMAGHSYGPVGTIVAAGECVGVRNQRFNIDRLRAGLVHDVPRVTKSWKYRAAFARASSVASR